LVDITKLPYLAAAAPGAAALDYGSHD